MAIDLYDVHAAERREQAHASFKTAPVYGKLVAKAAEKGFQHASILEIHASARAEPWAKDLFCWRGGLWVKASSSTASIS